MLRRSFLLGLLSAPVPVAALALPRDAVAAVPRDAKGFHAPDWFRPQTFDLRRDLAAARAEQKPLVIFWEMVPCIFCDVLHDKALQDPAMRAYVADRFYCVRYDRQGKQTLYDFNGAERTERDTSFAHRVLGTPTLEFRTADLREPIRVQGFLGYNLLQSSFEYVDERGYEKLGFAAWLRQRPR